MYSKCSCTGSPRSMLTSLTKNFFFSSLRRKDESPDRTRHPGRLQHILLLDTLLLKGLRGMQPRSRAVTTRERVLLAVRAQVQPLADDVSDFRHCESVVDHDGLDRLIHQANLQSTSGLLEDEQVLNNNCELLASKSQYVLI